MTNEWLDAYFERIEFHDPVNVSLETLRALHTAHTFHVPFENLDIHTGRKIQLDPQSLIDKLIYQRRGGYCFEMNGLFSLVLETIGFKLDRLCARIMFGYTETRPRTHQLSLIHLGDEDWIADVGYGTRGLIAPLLLSDGYTERQFSEQFRLVKDADAGFRLQGEIEGEWMNLYQFTLEKYLPVDFIPVNYYTSTSPDSHFTQRRVCAMPVARGRLSMVNETMKMTIDGVTTQQRAENIDQYLMLLDNYFRIHLTPDQISYPG